LPPAVRDRSAILFIQLERRRRLLLSLPKLSLLLAQRVLLNGSLGRIASTDSHTKVGNTTGLLGGSGCGVA